MQTRETEQIDVHKRSRHTETVQSEHTLSTTNVSVISIKVNKNPCHYGTSTLKNTAA